MNSSTASQEIDIDKENGPSSRVIYSSLKPDTIRLLRIKSSSHSCPNSIELVLEEVSLESPIPYKALSYAWGNKANPATIKLNGVPFLATENLFVALTHLQLMGFYDPLWVDALCINQIDTDERDSQVRQMPQIYKQATQVLAWLGPEADDSSIAFAKITAGAAQNFSVEWVTKLYQANACGDLSRFFDAVMAIFFREYWNRLWVVQEVAFAQDVILSCGLAQMPFARLVSFGEALKHHGMDKALAHGRVGRIIRLYLGAVGPFSLKYPGSARAPIEFEDAAWMLARNAVSKQCRDPRDRIYACHGLFSPGLRDRISIEYSKGPAEVIMNATRAVVESTHRLDIVLLKRRSESGLKLEQWERSLPSWAPVLDDKFGQQEIFFDALNPKFPHSASDSREAVYRFSDDGRILMASGILVGHINKLQERRYQPGDRLYGGQQEHANLIRYVFNFRDYLGDRLHSREELVAFWSAILGRFFQLHVVMEAPRDHESGPDMYEEVERTTDAVINFAVEMQNMWKRVQDRQGLTGMLQSFLGMPLFTSQQTAFIEPLYRHFDYRAFFCFERPRPSTQESSRAVGDGNRRPVDIGVGPAAAKEGDAVCVLYGCKVPVILRPADGRYQVVGDAHLSSFMNGEALSGQEDGLGAPQEFCLE